VKKDSVEEADETLQEIMALSLADIDFDTEKAQKSPQIPD
jgi:hypothetical protein